MDRKIVVLLYCGQKYNPNINVHYNIPVTKVFYYIAYFIDYRENYIVSNGDRSVFGQSFTRYMYSADKPEQTSYNTAILYSFSDNSRRKEPCVYYDKDTMLTAVRLIIVLRAVGIITTHCFANIGPDIQATL